MSSESDDEFADRLLRENSPHHASLWIDKAGTETDYAWYGLYNDLGQLKTVHNKQSAAAVEEIIDKAIALVRNATLRATIQWRQDLISLPKTLKAVTLISELLDRMGATADTTFEVGDRVEVYWWSELTWYPGTVRNLCRENMAIIEFDNSLDTGCFTTDNLRRPLL